MPQPIDLVNPAAFWAKVVRCSEDECWLWQGRIDHNGYGEHRRSYAGKRRAYWRAHRVAYELLVGPIADGLVLDHLCRVKLCVNPAHLQPVTSGENVRRGEVGKRNQEKTHCVRGHEFTPENTRVDKRGFRNCLTCRRQWVSPNA